MQRFNTKPKIIPIFIYKKNLWSGFTTSTISEIENKLKNVSIKDKKNTIINIPFIGSISLKNSSLILSTISIAFVDGFNPCSLWVLSFLISFIIHSKSRKRMIFTGITFLISTSLIYGLFITGVINTLSFTSQIPLIKTIIALLTLFIGLVNIKEYFFFKKYISFTIPKHIKPKIYQSFKKIFNKKKINNTKLIITTSLVAAGITIVELPCTAGFPVLWGNIITSNKISITPYLLLLVLYLLTYLLDEILLVGISLITLNAFKINQKKGENLKLLSGIVMTGLSIILLFLPETLNEFRNMVKFFIICICISCFIILQKKFTTYIKQFKFKQ